MRSRPVDISLFELVMECPDVGGGMWRLIYINMLKGGDERPRGTWWVVSFPSPRCEFSPTSQDKRTTMREAYAIAGTLID